MSFPAPSSWDSGPPAGCMKKSMPGWSPGPTPSLGLAPRLERVGVEPPFLIKVAIGVCAIPLVLGKKSRQVTQGPPGLSVSAHYGSSEEKMVRRDQQTVSGDLTSFGFFDNGHASPPEGHITDCLEPDACHPRHTDRLVAPMPFESLLLGACLGNY